MDAIVKQEMSLSATSKQPLGVIPPQSSDVARVASITRIVYETEAVKQIVLTDQQRDALIRMLAATDMTVDQIVIAARRVTDKTTFGRIAFEHWLEAEPEPEKVTVRGECSYCGTEWWGPVELKCPKCFPSKSAPKPKPESVPKEVMALLAPLERKMEMR